MAKHNETGVKGEQLAIQFLMAKGYRILHTNWRCRHKEVDIIAQKDHFLVFLEIKTRTGLDFGFPEEAVTRPKQWHLKAAALDYLEQFPSPLDIRFDVISILLDGGQATEIVHFEDAF